MTSAPLGGADAERALRDGAGAVTGSRDLVVCRGPDAATFLHSQLTQDIPAMGDGDRRYSFLLEPQGKVVALLEVTRVDAGTFELACAPGAGGEVEASLRRFLLRTRMDLTTEEGVAWTEVRGSAAGALSVGVAGLWPTWPGRDLPRVSTPPPEVPAVDPAVHEAVRIDIGPPVAGRDVPPGIIPQEAGIDDLAISFTKGCYRGQELVERVHSRGRPRWLLRRLRAGPGTDVPPPGADVVVDDRPAGTVTSAARLPASGEVVAMARLRAEIGPGTEVRVADGTARVRPLLG